VRCNFYCRRHDGVPLSIVILWWERHLAAIPIEAGRLTPKDVIRQDLQDPQDYSGRLPG
jgi:hypothetical protein